MLLKVLLSGDHAAIAAWRRRNALERTAQLRPDLLDTAALSEEEKMYVAQFIQQKEAERL